MTGYNIGVLALQGDVEENIISTKKAMMDLQESGTVEPVKTPEQIDKLDGLIIPGGESTMMGELSLVNGSLKKIKEKIEKGMPVFGICAGLILLSKDSQDRIVGKTNQPLLEQLEIGIERNSFGRQEESFEAEVSMNEIQIPKFHGVFIRSPSILEVGKGVEIISRFSGRIVAVKKDNILGTSFHPELTSDCSIHKYFVNMIKISKHN